MTGRTARRGWQGVVAGAVTIVVGVVLIADNVYLSDVSALPIVGAGTGVLLRGFYELFKARQDHRGKHNAGDEAPR
jgi:uncharacterized membrane protein HdeD (DUF308 family)